MLTTRSRTFPLPSQQPIEVDFIENRNAGFQKAGIERTCSFDIEHKRFVPATIVGPVTFEHILEPAHPLELQRTRESLQSAIEKLKEQKGKKSDKIAKFHLSDAHSWTDIVRIVSEAENTYLKEDTVPGKVRKAFRKLGENAKSIKPYIGLLPDGSYKTLSGGLTLILTVMTKKAEMLEKMADILDELPLTIAECEDYAQLYQGNNSLRGRIEEIYIQLVQAMEDMIRWYTEKPLTRMTKSVLKTDAMSDKIDRRIKSIHDAKEAFEKEAMKYLHYRADNIDRIGQETHENVKTVGNIVSDNAYQLRSIRLEIEKLASEKSTAVTNGLLDVLQDQRVKTEWFRERDLERDSHKKEIMTKDEEIRELRSRLEKKIFRVSSLAALLQLQLPFDAHFADLECAFNEGITSSTKLQWRAKQIASSNEFRKWNTTKHSSTLCINSNFDQDPPSATSFLAAMLAKTLQRDAVLVLPFFCGMHTDFDVSGPVFLLRTMLAQIFCIEDIDEKKVLSDIDESHVQAMNDASFKQYLNTFKNLLEKLLKIYKRVVVIVDGIEFYDMNWQKEVGALTRRLSRLTVDSPKGSLKVLFMASSHSALLCGVKRADLLDMPDDLDGDGSDYSLEAL